MKKVSECCGMSVTPRNSQFPDEYDCAQCKQSCELVACSPHPKPLEKLDRYASTDLETIISKINELVEAVESLKKQIK